MKTLITLTLTAAEGGDNGVKIPADGIAIFDPKNGQVNADGDLVSGDRIKATVTDGVLLDAEGNDGVWLEPGQYWASVTSVTSRVTKYVEVPESDAPILLTSLFELEAVPGWRLTEGVVAEVKQARDEAVAAAEAGGADPELIEGLVTDLLLSGEIELPPGEQGPEGPRGERGPEGPQGIQGPPGVDGAPGEDGAEGPAGRDGAPGSDGASAYQVAVSAGFAGTETEWLESLVGPEGPAGRDGIDGQDGAPGEPGRDGEEGPQGPPGTDGKDGAEGPRGPQGLQGEPGIDGADGKSAYQIALDEGFVGDEAAFLDSLVGPEGPQGQQGPEGPQGPAGEIPELLVGNITDATPTGKNLMLAATEGAARNALGLQTGATAIAGAYSELENGTQTNSRVWSPKTLSDYTTGRIESMRTEVNVKDYGAKGDGTTDDHAAIMAAIGTGGRKVVFPAGTYMISDSITVPSNTEISGSGIDVTTIKFLDTAPIAVWGITNRDREAGNTNIYVHGLTVDWNVQRTGSTAVPDAGGGSNASCVTFGHVTHSRISHVKAINAGLHGFDVTCASVTYPYEGDGAPDAAGPSQYVYIDNCEAEAWGDDGFTTHHSEFIFITNCYAHDARQRGNNNAFEIDDGSRHIYLSGNTSRNCYAGIEIKAHGNASAGRQVQIAGHLSVNDVRSYNWRHIGHHSGSDPVSVSAFDIIASDLVSLWPNNNLGYYEDAQPRSIVISAFGRVSVTNFTAIGDPGYDYASEPAAAIQYRAHDVTLTNFNSSGFTTSSTDMLISGTTNNIAINGFVANKSALRGLQIGTGVGTISLSGLRLTGTGTGLHGVDAGNVQNTSAFKLADDFFITGYTNVVRMFSTNYTSKSYFLMGSPAVPSGTTSMKALASERSYYISSANFANMGSDRPTGESGSWLLYNESASVAGSVVMQRLVKSVISGEPVQYFRILNRADNGVTNWFRVSTTAVDYAS